MLWMTSRLISHPVGRSSKLGEGTNGWCQGKSPDRHASDQSVFDRLEAAFHTLPFAGSITSNADGDAHHYKKILLRK